MSEELSAVLAGPDADGIGRALEAEGVRVVRVDGIPNRPALEEAGIVDADLLVLTDAGDATAIPVAKDINPDLRVVAYVGDSLPDFARGQADLMVDPALLDASVVAEELAN